MSHEQRFRTGGAESSCAEALGKMDRRAFLSLGTATLAAALAPWPVSVSAQDQPVLTFEDVVRIARENSTKQYTPATLTLRPPFDNLSYDHYRSIRFRPEARPFDAPDSSFAVDLVPPGNIFRDRVAIGIVHPTGIDNLTFRAEDFGYDPENFNFPDGNTPRGNDGNLSYTGFRLRYRLNRPDHLDEFAVFQGASYFRAVARNMLYGLSARGLAIGTADQRGEEFPVFRQFWIHQPTKDAAAILVQALLDSDSCAGAYEFEIRPGDTTVMDIRCRLFPRRSIDQIGIAPLTSMYYFGPDSRNNIDDFRGAVHDSQGLQMITGTGRRLWRPLTNPARVQLSAFQDENPQGFGLTQRKRSFDYYQDAEARYEKRPSGWVEPLGGWGAGAVVLVEIPTDNEYNDNIVVFWRPREPLGPTDEGHAFRYRLHWCEEPPDALPIARVDATRGGIFRHDASRRLFVVDFEKPPEWNKLVEPKLWAGAGTVGSAVIRDLPVVNLLRTVFTFEPGNANSVEFQLTLEGENGAESETWLYQWTTR
jgi:periplasmic glucans biosynthesis protein